MRRTPWVARPAAKAIFDRGLMCYKYPMKILDSQIALSELKVMAEGRFGNLVKAVVDIERRIMAVDGELHADEEALLLENGSLQENLWGINIYPELEGPERIEFDSVINIRPSQGNLSRGVDDPGVQERIIQAVMGLMK
jgi:hypothetical protein